MCPARDEALGGSLSRMDMRRQPDTVGMTRQLPRARAMCGCTTVLRLEASRQAVVARGAGGAWLHGARRARQAGSHTQLGLGLSASTGLAAADEQLGPAWGHWLIAAVAGARLGERVDDQARRANHLDQKRSGLRRGSLPAKRTGAEVQIQGKDAHAARPHDRHVARACWRVDRDRQRFADGVVPQLRREAPPVR
eukprot:scaffold1440_cov114-Isochrysis_galbana.AAC.8